MNIRADVALDRTCRRPAAGVTREGWVSAGAVIAVIDDDASMRTALVKLFRSLGYDVRGFESAEEFLGYGPVRSFSCLVTDIQLPGMSGIELQQHIKANQYSLPVIMITARHDVGLEERALASGAAFFLRKPVEAKMLLGCLENVLKA
jgi:FixJ family two-component response regulator